MTINDILMICITAAITFLLSRPWTQWYHWYQEHHLLKRVMRYHQTDRHRYLYLRGDAYADTYTYIKTRKVRSHKYRWTWVCKYHHELPIATRRIGYTKTEYTAYLSAAEADTEFSYKVQEDFFNLESNWKHRPVAWYSYCFPTAHHWELGYPVFAVEQTKKEYDFQLPLPID